jgi:cyclophilin family peptidyl-prolyl cis-trans isomerase
MLRRGALALAALALLAGCGSGKPSTTTTTETVTTTAAATTTAPKPARHGVAGVIHVKTSLGSFAFTLAPAAAPNATRSFVLLTRRGFFDGLTIHRVVPDFVIQGGDPNGNGTGGPGYTTHDPVAPTTKYPVGTVAMAKTNAEPAGSGGSQFFIVTAPNVQLVDPNTNLPLYAVIGHVTSGIRVVLAIGRLATDPQTQAPLRKVVMRRVTYTKR